MKIIKLLAGGAAIVVTYNVGKLVGELKVMKSVTDGLEEIFPGLKRHTAKLACDKIIDHIFDKSKEGKESQ